jgi:hypothetical protein
MVLEVYASRCWLWVLLWASGAEVSEPRSSMAGVDPAGGMARPAGASHHADAARMGGNRQAARMQGLTAAAE